MNPRSFIMHWPDGAFACDPVPIRDFEQTLGRFFGSQRRLMRNAFDLAGDSVDVAAGIDGALCSVLLKRLTLDTCFSQVGDFLVPTFERGGMRLKLDWEAPSDMQLRFAALCHPSWTATECFLFARGPQPGFVKLPLPNIYDDGRVCMGDEVRGTIRGDTLAACFKAALESFRSTSWNTDLNNHGASVRALFRWKSDRTPVPAPADWRRFCQTVSRQEMEELCPA